MFVDTNVLVAVRFTSAPDHATACVNVDRAAGAESLCVSRQILREYLATVTRPQIWSQPLGMIAHGERRLITSNARDFRRYGARLELVGMAAA